MLKLIGDIVRQYKKEPQQGYSRASTPLPSSLDDAINRLKQDFSDSADLTVRALSLSGHPSALITIDNMIDKQVLAEGILSPLLGFNFDPSLKKACEQLCDEVLCTPELNAVKTMEDLQISIMSGFVVILIDGSDTAFSVGIQGYASRSISEPESDIVQRGAREGFVESLRVNMTLLRRRLKTPDLRFETMTIGKLSNTEIALCYLRSTVSTDILDQLKERLKNIPLDTVLTAGYLVPFLEERPSVFCGVGVSERPDAVCGKLTEGRIAILTDGVPTALIVPHLFEEHFQSLDDYSNRAFFATFTRLLKYCAFLISILLPGLFVALGTFHPEMFPALMLNRIASSIASTPFSLTLETILILFIYEIMREAGLRMPRPLGYAVSIVGGMVVGEAAVNAGLIGAPTLMVIAISAISSYVVPDLYAPAALCRLLFTLAGGWLGIWGIAILSCVLLCDLCGKSSFGIPYTSPVTPMNASAFRDVLIRADWKILSKKRQMVQDMPGAQPSCFHIGKRNRYGGGNR